MACQKPATGARASHFYVEEVDCGVTPDNPVWNPLRFTSGNLQQTRDSLQSQELDGSREVADLRLGSKQSAGEISVELSISSYDDILQAALGGTWASGLSFADIDVTVDGNAKTFTRNDAGDFIADGVEVGALMQFADFANEGNNTPFVVSAVTAGVVTAGFMKDGVLVSENVADADYSTGDKLEVGTARRTFSILTHYADAEDGVNGVGTGEYHITRGVEITAFNFDIAVNAMVTGSFSTIGRSSEADILIPAGSTFPSVTKTEPYSGVDGKIIEADQVIGFFTSLSQSLDNGAQAQFEIGSDEVSFIEQSRANSTLSIATFFLNSTLLKKFLNETETSIQSVLSNSSGAMSFTYHRVVYTSGAPSIDGEASVTQSLEAQALAQPDGSTSLTIQRLAA